MENTDKKNNTPFPKSGSPFHVCKLYVPLIASSSLKFKDLSWESEYVSNLARHRSLTAYEIATNEVNESIRGT